MFLTRVNEEIKGETLRKDVVRTVRELLEERLPEMGCELWNVEYVKAGADFNLTVFIDKPGGIGTDDCEAVSRYLGAKLDEADIIADSYYLIVSSPGLDRLLLTDAHYARYAGSEVDVGLYKGVNGTKKLSGVLETRTEAELVLTVDGERLALPRELVSTVRLKVII
jgi:ribosome maturation factor RimP